ncbi:lipoprotein [Magnetospirillum sulfuroxidans]|uniref:Lipoprotein n=1 Tax=Magnetospirillum sulfuroxidans TaxID=611300 RepID=A0ABS5I8V7_9PROT|nr:lipoprotein [Magnetospirillum sulfuroxidans]MBR9970163.1 lipoprotein [Magnetospirillum sulfuroxidans]
MKIILAATALLMLAACSAPYETALESRITSRPQAPVTKADAAALAPYESASYFKTK